MHRTIEQVNFDIFAEQAHQRARRLQDLRASHNAAVNACLSAGLPLPAPPRELVTLSRDHGDDDAEQARQFEALVLAYEKATPNCSRRDSLAAVSMAVPDLAAAYRRATLSANDPTTTTELATQATQFVELVVKHEKDHKVPRREAIHAIQLSHPDLAHAYRLHGR
jgi:hypothetical protein